MWRCPGPWGSEAVFGGTGFDQCNEVFDGLDCQRRMDREHRGRANGNRYRVEVLVGIVGYRVEHGRVDDDIWRNHKDGVTVGCRSRPLTHADIATGTSDVLDVELFSEMFGQFLCGKARQYVGRT